MTYRLGSTMRTMFVVLLAIPLLASTATGPGRRKPAASTARGNGRVAATPLPIQLPPANTLRMSSDGSYEIGYAWQYGGIVPPNWGAFAEPYTLSTAERVTALVLDLTQVGAYTNQTLDAYVWEDGSGAPGNVACLRTGLSPGSIAQWPNLTRVQLRFSPLGVPGTAARWWFGYWADWPGSIAAWYVGADLNGPGGDPRTLIAPGIGYPTGWQDVSAAWGPTRAIGIGIVTEGGSGSDAPSFATLAHDVDGGTYRVSGNTLRFRYEEEYLDGQLTYAVYNNSHAIVIDQNSHPLGKTWGDNRYELDLSALVAGGYYILEVANDKREKSYLRFRYSGGCE